MTIEELEEKMAELEKLQTETENAHAKLKAQIAELKALREELPEPPHPRWKPERDDLYYVTSFGIPRTHYWKDDELDHSTFAAGNLYQTEDEAEFAIERLKVLAEMREWAGSWRNVYTLAWDNIHHKIKTHASLVYCGEMCFATREDAENCIKAVGEERLKKYYFMIPEEETNNG